MDETFWLRLILQYIARSWEALRAVWQRGWILGAAAESINEDAAVGITAVGITAVAVTDYCIGIGA